MKSNLIKALFVFAVISLLCACSVDKLEARLAANPQCKEVINPKTGAVMPCPGSDKLFYREAGLAPAKSAFATVSAATPSQLPSGATAPASTTPNKNVSTQAECKPQIHKKSGGTLPCPAPD